MYVCDILLKLYLYFISRDINDSSQIFMVVIVLKSPSEKQYKTQKLLIHNIVFAEKSIIESGKTKLRLCFKANFELFSCKYNVKCIKLILKIYL